MAELGRSGHRKRMRESYLNGDMENAPDHNLLELFLSLIIPQKDVKPLAYDLINKFGTLENVFSATPDELMAISGIGDRTAIAISLSTEINRRIKQNHNKGRVRLTILSETFAFCENLYENERNEKAYLVTLNNNRQVIGCYKLAEGSVNSVEVNTKNAVTIAIKDSAASVMLVHNHPDGENNPSAGDLQFTMKFKYAMSAISVAIFDHIIVGVNGCRSMRANSDFIFS